MVTDTEYEHMRQRAEAAERRLAEIREVWTGSEGIPEPKYASEAYLLRLCKQMYEIACGRTAVKEPT